MSIGIPMQVIGVDGLTALACDDAITETIDLTATGPVEPGTWVLTKGGQARQTLSAQDAVRIRFVLDRMRQMMMGPAATAQGSGV